MNIRLYFILLTIVLFIGCEKESKNNLFYVPKNTTQHKSILESLKNVQRSISNNTFKTLQMV